MRHLTLLLALPLLACASLQTNRTPGVAPTEADLRAVLDGEHRVRVVTADFGLDLRKPTLGPDGLSFSEAKAFIGKKPPVYSLLRLQEIRRVSVYRPKGLIWGLVGALGGYFAGDYFINSTYEDQRKSCPNRVNPGSCVHLLDEQTRQAFNAGSALFFGGIGYWMGRTSLAWRVVYPKR